MRGPQLVAAGEEVAEGTGADAAVPARTAPPEIHAVAVS